MLSKSLVAVFSRERCAFASILSCAAMAILWLCASSLAAQSAYFSGVTSSLPGSYTNPTGVAVDSSGNLFISDGGNGTVSEILASNGTINPIASGLGQPWAVAVDSSENVYTADLDGTVKEILASNGSVNTLVSGYSLPLDVAVDGSGNVYFLNGGASAVFKIPAGGGAVTTVGGGFTNPHGLAVDRNGNIYVADASVGTVSEMPSTCTSSGCVTVLASGFNAPEGVAIDPGGDVFFSAANGNTLQEILAVNGVIPASPTILSLGSGFNHPIGVALDGKGDVFVANYSGPSVLEVATNGVTLGTVNIGAASAPTALIPFTFTATETLGAPVVLTQGETGKDFTQTGTTCTGTMTAGNPCTVTVQFSPKTPGLRLGAVQLETSSGTLLATANIYGIGAGPQVSFPSNSAPATIGSSFTSPSGVAVDGSGDVFVADFGHQAVKEIVAVAGQVSASSVVNTVGSGFTGPSQVAVDGSGDVFVADGTGDAVDEIVANNGQVSSTSSVTTVASGFSPSGIAVDSNGDVFVSDSANNAVKEILAVNGQVSSNSSVVAVGSGFTTPKGLALDAAGDVFVADNGNKAVKEIVAVNGQVSASSTVNTVGSGFTSPFGVAVDASGDVFVADGGNAAVVDEIVASNGQVSSSSTVLPLSWGFSAPAGIAIDSGGDVFVADQGSNAVSEMPLATPPSLSFPSATEQGTTDIADGPASAIIANNGNQTLTFNLPETGDNPGLSTTNFAWDDSASTCTQTTPSSSTAYTLAEGASCIVAVDFTPTTVGILTDNLALTDNDLNAASATQQIPVSGSAGVAGAITSPTSGSSLTSASTTFSWNAGSGGVTGYFLHIGTTLGGTDLANIGPLSGTSATVNLPTNGAPIYVQLQTVLNGTASLFTNYNYTEFSMSAGAISSPTNTSTLTSASTTFVWSAGTGGVTGYFLHIGTTPGGTDLANIGPLSGTSATVNLPTNGATIYAQLQTNFTGGTSVLSSVTSYTEFSMSAGAITSPTNTSTLTSASTTFTWSAGTGGVTGYFLHVGTTPGAADLVNIGPLSGTSATVNLPTNGATIYAQLQTNFTGGSSVLSSVTSYTEFSMSAGAITSPTNTSTLTGASTTFVWSAGTGGVTGYFLHVGTTPGGEDLVNIGPLSGTSATVNLPTNGATIYAQLQTNYTGGSSVLSSVTSYTEFSMSAGAITSPTNTSTLTGASTTFVWSAGTGGVTGYFLHVGTTPGGEDLVNIGPLSGTSATVNLPTNGATIYAQLQTNYTGGSSVLSSVTSYTEATISDAATISPGISSTLPGASANSTEAPGQGVTLNVS